MRLRHVSKRRKRLDIKAVFPKIEELCRRHGIKLFYIFGSQATGKAGKLSDIDVAILGKKDISLAERAELLDELLRIFQDKEIDIVDLRRAGLSLTHSILKKGVCLYAKSLGDKIDFEILREIMYLDTKWIREEYDRAMMRRIEHGTYGRRKG